MRRCKDNTMKILFKCVYPASPGPLFTKKTPSYGYRDPHDKPKTVWRPSQVYNGNTYTDTTIARSSYLNKMGFTILVRWSYYTGSDPRFYSLWCVALHTYVPWTQDPVLFTHPQCTWYNQDDFMPFPEKAIYPFIWISHTFTLHP